MTETQLPLTILGDIKMKKKYTYKLWMRRPQYTKQEKRERNKLSFKSTHLIKTNNNISNQLLQSQKEHKTVCHITELLTTSTTFPNFQRRQNKEKGHT